MVQELIHKAFYKLGPENIVGVRQAALYALMYYGTARFEEIKELELRQVNKKGASIEIQIVKESETKLESCNNVLYILIL